MAFEEQCKELIGLVEQVERPIKEGISVFDDEKRAEKRRQAEEYIKEIPKAGPISQRTTYVKILQFDRKEVRYH